MATQCTIVGVFDDRATADRVAQEIANEGVSRNRIQVMSSDAFNADAARGNAGLSGTAHHDSSGGGISGFFHRLFGSDDAEDDEHGRYAEAVRRGSTVVAVTADEDDEDRITDLMDRYDPVDIDRREEAWKERGYTGYDAAAAPFTAEESAREREYYDRDQDRGERSVPVVQEELQVGKRPVERSAVRVYRRMSEQPVEEQVHLREERVRVDRRPANRPATEADVNPAERVIEVTEMAEEPVIGKTARVVEEVVIGKETRERTETVRDKVRKSDVSVEQMDPSQTGGRMSATSDYDVDFRRDFESRYASDRNASYETYAPAYRYGYAMASDARYRGKRWEDVESTLRTDYERSNPNSAWDRTKGAVRYGWEKVTGKR
jgi:uncharacterized protein (TIGR02271 family)